MLLFQFGENICIIGFKKQIPVSISTGNPGMVTVGYIFDLQSNMAHCKTYQTYNFDFDTNPKKIVKFQHISYF